MRKLKTSNQILIKEEKTDSSASARSRFTARPRAGLRLEERDEQLLVDLFHHGVMSRSQIQTLYFGSLGRCNIRMRQLFDHQYVSRFFPPAAPYGAQAIYSIGKAATSLVARRLEMPLQEVAKQYRRNKTPSFLEHSLKIVDTYISFKNACDESSGVTLELWVPELECRDEYEIGRTGAAEHGFRKEVFKPDGFVRLREEEGRQRFNFFLEVDLGHTSTGQFMGKLLTHQRYLQSGLFEKVFGCDNFNTLVLTTSIKRLRNLKCLVEEYGSDLFWFTTFEAAKNQGVLGPIWHRPGENCESRLLDL